MQLESMWVHGLRRFGGSAPSRVRLDSPIVCLVGANEVGKSTLLDALAMAYIEPGGDPGDEPPVASADRTRGDDVPDEREIVRLRYRLDSDDGAILGSLRGASQLSDVRWLERKKLAGGSIITELDPVPVRDKLPRRTLADRIRTWRAGKAWADDDHAGTPADESSLTSLLELLDSKYRVIDPAGLEALASYLDQLELEPALVEDIRRVIAHETLPHPADEALGALEPLIPRFVRFDAELRDLTNEYDLSVAADEPPGALSNLADLAGLELRHLRDKISQDESGTVQDLLDSANATLRARFAAWTQEPALQVLLDHSEYRLLIHAKSGTGASMRLGERSDGLRQFVSLLTLTAQQTHRVPPILLIDEAEMHLHYDAQADLMSVLARQTAASQVIYTTHSAACLPEDLGTSVRVVKGIGDEMASTVHQQFWSEEPGLGALLLAMGAGSLAFVPLRPAVIVEGGGDLVLLPSLIREAVGQKTLGYQVVPGAANVPARRIAGLDLHGVKTAWVLDGDESGKTRRRFLMENGVPGERILLLKTTRFPLDLEDLVAAETYIEAVNAYARDVGASDLFSEADLPAGTCLRHRTVEQWCVARGLRPPGKTAIANKVLGLRGLGKLTAQSRRATLRVIHSSVIRLLGIE